MSTLFLHICNAVVKKTTLEARAGYKNTLKEFSVSSTDTAAATLPQVFARAKAADTDMSILTLVLHIYWPSPSLCKTINGFL